MQEMPFRITSGASATLDCHVNKSQRCPHTGKPRSRTHFSLTVPISRRSPPFAHPAASATRLGIKRKYESAIHPPSLYHFTPFHIPCLFDYYPIVPSSLCRHVVIAMLSCYHRYAIMPPLLFHCTAIAMPSHRRLICHHTIIAMPSYRRLI